MQERLTENDRIFVAELYPYKSFLKSKIWISTSKKESKDGKKGPKIEKRIQILYWKMVWKTGDRLEENS